MIELKSVFAGYGKKNILKNISLNISKGELVGIIGTNGSGKSTLLKTVVGIIPPFSGGIFIDGDDIKAFSRRDVARRITYLMQDRDIPDMTVRQMVLHGRFPHIGYPRRYSANDKKITENVLAEMQISNLAERSLSSLSGGMRQRAYIAMAMAQDTEYIMLDEPTTYLDIAAGLELMKNLRMLAESGKGIVAVMHDLPLAFTFFNRIIIINDGSIAAEGTPSEICNSDIIKCLFGVHIVKGEANSFYYKL